MTTTLTDIRNDGTVEEVIELLKIHPLARRFEFADMTARRAYMVTHFQIATDDPELITTIQPPREQNQQAGRYSQEEQNV